MQRLTPPCRILNIDITTEISRALIKIMDSTNFDMQGAIAQLRESDLSAEAMSLLDQHDGNLDGALEESMAMEYGGVAMGDKRSLKEATLTVFRKELCGDEGFRGLLKKYLDKPKDAAILTGAVAYVVEAVALPIAITPAIATLVVLYILRVGVDIFCEYAKPGIT